MLDSLKKYVRFSFVRLLICLFHWKTIVYQNSFYFYFGFLFYVLRRLRKKNVSLFEVEKKMFIKTIVLIGSGQ